MENIKIKFKICQPAKRVGNQKNPNPPSAGQNKSRHSDDEKPIFNKDKKFEMFNTAGSVESNQTFTIILPNLIHKSKKRNLH